MYNLASTADQYLSPALEYVTVKFNLSESVAGVTLLAFGNGAPDVFSSISAASQVSHSSSGDPNNLGNNMLATCGLMGSAFFISSIVIQLALVNQKVNYPFKQIQVTPIFFTRDLIFYCLVMVYLLGIMLYVHEIDLWVALGFLFAYAIYVTLVFLQSKNVIPDKKTRDLSLENEQALMQSMTSSFQSLDRNSFGSNSNSFVNIQTITQANLLVNELSISYHQKEEKRSSSLMIDNRNSQPNRSGSFTQESSMYTPNLNFAA